MTRSVSKKFHQNSEEKKRVSTHNEDDGNSIDNEVKALKTQLKRVEPDATKLKKQNLTLKTMLIVF